MGPLVGAAAGGLVYFLLIEIHHPDLNPDLEAEQPEENQRNTN